MITRVRALDHDLLKGEGTSSVLVLEVVHAAWVAAGRPSDTGRAGAAVIDSCARCGSYGVLTDVRHVVSRSFTGRDPWTTPCGSGLCSACTWAYRAPELRRSAHLVVCGQQPVLRPLDSSALFEALSQPVGPHIAVTVPRSGRKHLLPSARCGRVFLDDVALPWTRADAARLGVMNEVRLLGASDADLRQPAPPWPLIQAAGPKGQARLVQAWDELRGWRSQPAHLEAGLIATRRPRSTSPRWPLPHQRRSNCSPSARTTRSDLRSTGLSHEPHRGESGA